MVLKTENELIIKIPSDNPPRAAARIYALAYRLLKNKKPDTDERITEALYNIIGAIDPAGKVSTLIMKGEIIIP